MTSQNIPEDYEFVEKCILCESLNIKEFDNKTLMYKCHDCGLVFDNPRPTQKLIWEHYSQKGKYDHWIDSDTAFQKYWDSYLKKLLKYKQAGELLDIGAGIGKFLSNAKKHFNVTGVEVSDEAILVAKDMYGLDLIKGEFESIDFKGKKFDVISMSQILEHVPYPGNTIDHIKKNLVKGGIVFITVPNEASYSLRMVLAGCFSRIRLRRFKDFNHKGYRKIEIGKLDEIHLSHFSESNLNSILTQKGFEILSNTIEFHDTFMRKKGPIQIVRYLMLFVATVLKKLFKINIYNSFGIIAKLR